MPVHLPHTELLSAKGLAEALGGKAHGKSFMARCPAHDDQVASLSIAEKDGRLLVKCHAGCSQEAVIDALRAKGLWPERKAANGRVKTNAATYDYTDEHGALLFQAVRYAPKGFAQRRPDGKGGWIWNLQGVRLVPYRLPELMEAIALNKPVFVTEGEKDADNLARLGLTATCNSGGAGKWKAEHSAFLKNADVIVLPDNDVAGRDHAERVAASLKTIAKRIRMLSLLDLPLKGDVSDWLSDCGTVEALWRLADAAPDWQPSVKPDDWLPFGFRLRRNGEIEFIAGEDRDGDPIWQWLSSPIEVTAETSDATSREHGRLVRIYDRQNERWHDWAMPMRLLAGDPAGYRSELLAMGARLGLSAKARGALGNLIMTAQPAQKLRCVNRAGWHGHRFVLPDRTIGEEADRKVVFQSNRPVHAKFRTSGTLEDWKAQIGKPAEGNSRLMLSLTAAFAAPCLRLVNQEGGGFHIWGDSSGGKTTCLRVADSVWGGGGINGFLENWTATVNGLEGRAKAHCDALLCLQELGQADPDAAADAAYKLANGQGKQRMSADTQMRETAEWRLIFLSDGEITLDDKIRESKRGLRRMAGQAVRVIDIPADAGKGMGVFDHTAGFASGRALSEHLRSATDQLYGTAALAFLEQLVRTIPESSEHLRRSMDDFVCQNVLGGCGQVERVAKRFGLLAASGELAVSLEMLPWMPGQASEAAARCFSEWLIARGTTGASEIEQGIEQVRRIIERDGAARFVPIDDPFKTVPNRLGFVRRRRDSDPEVTEQLFYVLPQGWKEICSGFNPTRIAGELAERGILAATVDSKYSRIERLPGIGPARCYLLNAGKLFA